MLNTCSPLSYSKSHEKLSHRSPYFGSLVFHERPPDANTDTGFFPMIQCATSRLWTCCSTMLSPQVQQNAYQLRTQYSKSLQFGWRGWLKGNWPHQYTTIDVI